MELVLRQAAREDAGTLLELIAALARFEELEPPDEAARARLIADGWGDRPRFEAWLAEWQGVSVGYAILLETYSSFLARPTLYLEDIFVLPDYRRQGIGYALFRRVAQEAVTRGCGRMEWVCLDWNTRAQEFYRKIGARHMTEWFYYRLLPEQISQLPELIEAGDIDAG